MMSLETRTHIAAGNDRYLGPFSLVQVPIEKLDEYLKPVWSQEQPLTEVTHEKSDGTAEKIAEGFECSLEMKAIHDGKEITWVERHLVVRSLRHAKAAEIALQERLEKAQAAIQDLNVRKHGKRRFTELEPLQQAAQAILKRYDVEELLLLEYNERVQEHPVRKYRDRRRCRVDDNGFRCSAMNCYSKSIRRLGWRVWYQLPSDELSLERAVLAYHKISYRTRFQTAQRQTFVFDPHLSAR
jgi:transposase